MVKTKRKTRERLEDEAPAPEQYGARASPAKVCATCGHPYIKPCTTPAMLAECPNARFLKMSPNPTSLTPTRSKKSGKAK